MLYIIPNYVDQTQLEIDDDTVPRVRLNKKTNFYTLLLIINLPVFPDLLEFLSILFYLPPDIVKNIITYILKR